MIPLGHLPRVHAGLDSPLALLASFAGVALLAIIVIVALEATKSE